MSACAMAQQMHACYNDSASGEFVTILTIIKTTEEIEK